MACDPASRAGALLDVDLAAIAANWRSLRARAAPAECAAVIKADAYGLGAGAVAPALAAAGCRRFFVATLDEGIAARAALRSCCEIAVLNGPFAGTEAEFLAYRLVPVLNDPGQIALWRRAAPSRPALLHLDTGMSRLGLSLREFAAAAEDLRDLSWHGLLSHLACADEPLHPLNEMQRRSFLEARAALPEPPASLSASSGIFLGPAFHFDLVRPGAALYGVNPQPGNPNPMRPVVRLQGRILQVREIDAGQPVGYGAAWAAPAPARLATVALGYADGWLRSFGGRGSGRLGGMRVPLVGRVSMDLTVFDVTAVDPALARPGAFITLLDEDYGVDEAAADCGTIGYEVLTALGRRYHRRYRGRPAC
ncbi:MAG TPA: alanine racemase [Stellaceae bacterium]|nr:alanine racemase [Stellaceae bacterium]